jgi:hypothetical protein
MMAGLTKKLFLQASDKDFGGTILSPTMMYTPSP